MNFSELLNHCQQDGSNVSIDVPTTWMQGRAIFGGLQTVLALKAMRGLVADVPVRSLQTTFIQPGDDNTLNASASILRAGKSAIHVEARVTNGDKLVALVIGVFGSSRTSTVRRIPVQPDVACEKPRHFPYLEGLSPSFLQYFEAYWLKGDFPFRGKNERPENVVQLAMPAEDVSTESHIIAMADFIPPIALSYLKQLAAGSSMTWMLEFLTDKVNGLPMSGWRVDAEMIAAADGYTNQSLILWGPDGQPIALGRQNMVVFG